MAQALMTTEQNHFVQDGTEVPTILIAIARNIWLARNRRVFDNVTTPCSTIKNNVVQTLQLWKHRTKKEPWLSWHGHKFGNNRLQEEAGHQFENSTILTMLFSYVLFLYVGV
jgi:hypothetical protein